MEFRTAANTGKDMSELTGERPIHAGTAAVLKFGWGLVLYAVIPFVILNGLS